MADSENEMKERAKELLRVKGFKGVGSEFWMTAISDVMADFAASEVAAAEGRIAEYEKMFERTAHIEFWGNTEIWQHQGKDGKWLIEADGIEYDSPLEAYAAALTAGEENDG